MSKPEREAGGRHRLAWVVGTTAGWMVLTEAVLLVAAGRLPDQPASAWLLAATFGCVGVAATPVALGWRLLERWRWSRRGGRGRLLVGALLLLAATGVHYVNATLYVRLYLSLHLTLSAAQVLLAVPGIALLLAGLGDPRPRRAGLWAGWVASTATVLLGMVAAAHVARSQELRTLALNRTTIVAQALVAVRSTLGAAVTPLAPSPDPAAGAAPGATIDWRRMPVRQTSGLARGANLLLITVEAMRADRLPPNGPGVGLRHLESLAAEGVLFTRAYAAGCWTVPAMAALLKSQLASSIDYRGVVVDEDFNFFTVKQPADSLVSNPLAQRSIPAPVLDAHPTLAKMLSGGGYETATVPSWAIYHPKAGITAQFERAYIEPLTTAPPETRGKEPFDLNPAALRFLEQRDPARPFFLWLHYMQPHAPYVAQDEAAQGGSPIERYSSELREVDRRLGRLLDQLRREDALQHTVIVIHGDHGEEFGEHGGRFHATTVYEEQVRVPLVLHLPATSPLPRGQRITRPVSLVDLTPTLLDLLGVTVETRLFGRSLVPLLRGEGLPPRPVVTECERWGRRKRALIDWPFKLIVDETMGTVELYDLERDPGEQRGVVDRARVARMQAMLAEIRRPAPASPAPSN